MKSLSDLREEINAIDDELLVLIGKRLEIVKKIGEEKKRGGTSVHDQKREHEVIDRLIEKGEHLGLSQEVIKKIWMTFFKIAYIIERKNE